MDSNLIVNLLILLVTTFGGVASLALRKYVLTKTKSEEGKRLITLAWEASETAVRRVAQELVPKLKDAAADGKLSVSERRELREQGLIYTKDSLRGTSLTDIAEYFDLKTDIQVDEWLITRMEAAVHDLPRPGKSGQV